MDVYIGFGLLSAAFVVLVFVIFDSWFKTRNAGMAEMAESHDKSMEDPEFVVGCPGFQSGPWKWLNWRTRQLSTRYWRRYHTTDSNKRPE